MKFLQLCTIFLIIGCSLVQIQSLPIEEQHHQVAVLLPEYIQADLPASTDNPEESIVAAVPLTLLDVEDADKSSVDASEAAERSARGLGLGGFGGLGGLGGKFGGLGLGFKSFGGLGGFGFGGLHGLGFGGFKPFFGKHFG
ncbi:claw keratin-like [Calliphora vicina]|uniref:claw keratin-like n=1 Tax=Calliphora vicina TaxID=7373 RepID=UPI00325BC750